MKTILFRCHAGPSVGLGHVMRSLALAQALKNRGARVWIVCEGVPEALQEWIRRTAAQYSIIPPEVPAGSPADAALTQTMIQKAGPEWVVLDGYCFENDYHRWIKERPVLAIDDRGIGFKDADVIVNQNPGFSPADYQGYRARQIFLGPNYALLREDFEGHWVEKNHPLQAKNIFISTGGEDTAGLTKNVVAALRHLTGHALHVKVLWGPMNKTKLATPMTGPHEVEYVAGDFKTVRKHMLWADLAISAGGSMLWEYATCSVPVAAYICADNQQRGVRALAVKRAVEEMGEASQFKEDVFLQRMQQIITQRHLREELSMNLHHMILPRRVPDIVEHILQGGRT